MKFAEVYEQEKLIGWQCETETSLLFFGNRFGTAENITAHFKMPPPLFLKQVHGSTIVEGQKENTNEADGHWTRKTNMPLGIHTADCLPILLECSQTETVSALHAGWKGIERRILPTALEHLSGNGIALKNVNCFIGPHISKQSFEVGLDVATRLSKSSNSGSAHILPHANPEKKYVDLLSIAKDQFIEMGGLEKNIFSLNKDTYASQDFYSFRRDGKTGRLISFILLR